MISEETGAMDPPRTYRVGSFVLDLGRGALSACGGTEIPLRRKSFSLLRLLVENAGRLMTRETIMAALWPNIFVTDESLTQCVRDVRRALGNESRHLLRTIPGRGYIFEPEAVRHESDVSSQVIDLHAVRANETARLHTRVLPRGNETAYIPDGAGRHRVSHERSVRLSVRVMPLHSLHGSDAQERLAQSVTGDIVTDLNRHLKRLALADVQVLFNDERLAQSRPSFPDNHSDYVLRGGVRGTHPPSLNLQLLNAESGVCLWAERCELDRRRAVMARLLFDASLVLVSDVGRRIEALSRSDLTPQDLLLRGQALLLRLDTPTNRYQALRCFEQALGTRPDLVGAKLGLAHLLTAQLTHGWSRTVEHDEARAEVLLMDAFQSDSDIPAAHGIRGTLRRLQGRLDEARIDLELAIDRAPYFAMAASQLGMTLLYCGQPEAALPHFEAGARGVAHDSQRPLLLGNLGTGRLMLGDVDGAIEILREANADSQHPAAPLMLAAALGFKSASVEASAALRRAINLCPSWGTLSGMRNWVRRQARPDLMPIYEHWFERGLQRAGMTG
jgi:DNA-binding winged helix-turn-helix (wHTH) protein/TolB-like protein